MTVDWSLLIVQIVVSSTCARDAAVVVLVLTMTVGNAELDEVAPTFRELLMGTGVSFVQATVSDVDLEGREVSLVGTVADDLDGFVISDNQDESEMFYVSYEQALVLPKN